MCAFEMGIIDQQAKEIAEYIFEKLKLIIVVTSLKDKEVINKGMLLKKYEYDVEVMSLIEIDEELRNVYS